MDLTRKSVPNSILLLALLSCEGKTLVSPNFFLKVVSFIVRNTFRRISQGRKMEIGSSVVWILVIFVASYYLAAEAIGTTVKYNRHDFPSGFVFGAGTSAYQVEGAADQDGRTPSIWDTYTHAGYVSGATGDVACDAYHKYKEDVQLMADLSLDAYRFSISWSRLIPNGRGPVNPKGLEYYNNLINELIRNGIEPHVTLHHYDLPQALEDEYGGWLNKNIVRDFTAYADVCFMNFGDRVSHWTTINEANVFVMGGYDIGLFPPNRCSAPYCVRGTSSTSRGNSSTEPYIAAHHMIVAHAKVANLYRKKYQGKQYGSVGINLFSYWCMPSTNSTEDLAATQRVNDFYLGWFLHPMVYGDYPSSVKASAGSRLPAFTDLESELVKGSLDFIGVNFYAPVPVRDNSESLNWDNRDLNADIGATLMLGELIGTSFQFPVAPWALKGLLEYIHQIYPSLPIYIHENGQSTQRNSSLEDTSRVKSLHANIGGVLDAIRGGVDVRGYFTWSLLDGFELFDGYKSAYGLYYVDLDDPHLRRHPKLSATWYSQFLNGKDVSSDEEIDKKELRSSV